MNMRVDFKRFDGLLDTTILSRSSISAAGTGGSASLLRNLARLGIGKITLADFDSVETHNIATQGYELAQVGQNKARAVADDIAAINPQTDVLAHECPIEELTEAERQAFTSSDILLGVTDSIQANGLVNQWAIEAGKDALFGGCYAGCIGTEITGTFPDVIAEGRGCHRCFTDPRFRAAAEGEQAPPFFQRHVLIAEMLNVQLGYLIVSLLHLRAGSDLRITKLAQRFLQQPLLMTRIDPDFYAAPGEMFSDLAEGYGALVSRHWHRDVPADFICPDCGTPGV
jgi:hypothetical protein